MPAFGFQKFHYHTIEELREEIAYEGIDNIHLTEDLSPLGYPVKVGTHIASNAMAILPMEGCDCNLDGSPSYMTCRRYLRFAAGGSSLIWWEANTVVEEGKANPSAMMINKDNINEFSDLVANTKEIAREKNNVNLLNIIQLTHSGRYSRPHNKPEPMVAFRDPILDPRSGVVSDDQVVTDTYLDDLIEHYVEAALNAQEAGFDGVDIKAVHKYLVSELLGGFTRRGRYGGEKLENRARFLLQTIKAVREAVGPDFIIACRINVFDVHPYPYGFGVEKNNPFAWDSSEPKRLIKMLIDEGVDLLGLSSSNPYYIYPQWGRPFDMAPAGIPLPKDSQLKIIASCFRYVSELQDIAGNIPIVGNEYSWLRQFWPNAGAANLSKRCCGFVGQGRSSFAYPDAARDILLKGHLDPKKCCIACSKCTQIMRDHGSTGCVVRDQKIFLSIYKAGRALAKAKAEGSMTAIKQAEAEQIDTKKQAMQEAKNDLVILKK
jgi:2,4-dienoyl-CoA reductase-like NADH-dependent reductase (Old Yellow Enzyme family)